MFAGRCPNEDRMPITNISNNGKRSAILLIYDNSKEGKNLPLMFFK